jgi:hypothetical protein
LPKVRYKLNNLMPWQFILFENGWYIDKRNKKCQDRISK